MLKLCKFTPRYQDPASLYELVLSPPYTVKTLIEAILKERDNEWGSIEITNGYKALSFCNYQYGELQNEIKKEYLDNPVIYAFAFGGQSRMDYSISI